MWRAAADLQSLPSVLLSSALCSCGYWSASFRLAAWAQTMNAFIGRLMCGFRFSVPLDRTGIGIVDQSYPSSTWLTASWIWRGNRSSVTVPVTTPRIGASCAAMPLLLVLLAEGDWFWASMIGSHGEDGCWLPVGVIAVDRNETSPSIISNVVPAEMEASLSVFSNVVLSFPLISLFSGPFVVEDASSVQKWGFYTRAM